MIEIPPAPCTKSKFADLEMSTKLSQKRPIWALISPSRFIFDRESEIRTPIAQNVSQTCVFETVSRRRNCNKIGSAPPMFYGQAWPYVVTGILEGIRHPASKTRKELWGSAAAARGCSSAASCSSVLEVGGVEAPSTNVLRT